MSKCFDCAVRHDCKLYPMYQMEGREVVSCPDFKRRMSVSINGAKVQDEMKCPWCGGEMHRKGATYMGAGTNSYTLWCECGGIMHCAKNFSRKIDGFSIEYKFKEEEGENSESN